MATEAADDIRGAAVISDCGRYRYRLGREWNPDLPKVCFVMVNPSKADAVRPDPTITRCIGFARSWGGAEGGPFGGIDVVNLFALRSTDVTELKRASARGEDVIGPLNDQAITEAAAFAGLVVCAWGVKAKIPKRHVARPWHVTHKVLKGFSLFCLGLTKCGQPGHPLMLAGVTPLVEYRAG